ncbi:MAG TPA: dTDP-4-dehydrorhamnose 3,5-epimerase [Candidatus Agrococcus pullicola]|uniref:dTDP-4-dehydrorhamnose 3,5-epimerase n=1 Tax=Candidatus Agrococcus pullicola TaxID=2838429 RepID=A0A9D1YU11_9MICO|nr:dTDP-4-dehydrorhamnose 3,5-epimerase [Candidatus Agrococcus pullicola]
MAEIIDFDVETTDIEGLVVVRMKQVLEARGAVREFFRASAFRDAGYELPPFQQINVTETKPGAVRGMHGEAMTKLVAIAHGTAYGAWVDARPESSTRGTVVQTELRPGVQVLVPEGVCNGFQSTGEAPTQYVYCFTREWTPDMQGVAITPLDPQLGIRWPLPIDASDREVISEKDSAAPTLSEALAAL